MVYVAKRYVRFLLDNYIEILVKNPPTLDSITDGTTGSCYEIVKCVFTLVAFLYRSAAFGMYTQ